jgi:hypothetical protein
MSESIRSARLFAAAFIVALAGATASAQDSRRARELLESIKGKS